ncbi:bifunctional adenosylcobinamide kinase/adenosylcobinamide-phosphate guanylyltransferase [Actinomarinicola tropica]|uniref:Adenosylcobinamide kinase n=1 Tax=Actinomarinicola tropica TaxID=2789776 RepID=A0A5Q2RPX6_9ACTN|nr:bifunctional adenosylcobinamide kinase/adenosylcobinamide-phosphate guanylyltransferase [Actinomarinicola tropica]QGG95265.1 bifunctional adenosylcobinamide kinase/adenosylcobinamide-phosphate guanylyltransferase [Actinomarinicola tropica]
MIVLVLGGARSGKSAVAEQRAHVLADGGPVTYVATMVPSDDDADLAARLEAHRARRSATWHTVEPPFDLAEVLATTPGTVLVDALGPWVAARPDMEVDTDGLVAALRRRSEPVVLVSDEVGMGVHPETAAGRRFRDALGALNQALAAAADESLLVVAGRVLRLEAP